MRGVAQPKDVEEVQEALAAAPYFLLLDFRHVSGLDATAARSFSLLFHSLHTQGVEMIITHLPPSAPAIEKLLRAHKVISDSPLGASPSCRYYSHLNGGLQYCERRMMAVATAHGLCREQQQHMTLEEVLHAHLQLPQPILPAVLPLGHLAQQLEGFLVHRLMDTGEVLFSPGEPPDHIFILLSGTLVWRLQGTPSSGLSRLTLDLPKGLAQRLPSQDLRYGPGGIVGDFDFFLQRPRSASVVCEERAQLRVLSRAEFERMAVEAPHLLNAVTTIVLRNFGLSSAHLLEALSKVQ